VTILRLRRLLRHGLRCCPGPLRRRSRTVARRRAPPTEHAWVIGASLYVLSAAAKALHAPQKRPSDSGNHQIKAVASALNNPLAVRPSFPLPTHDTVATDQRHRVGSHTKRIADTATPKVRISPFSCTRAGTYTELWMPTPERPPASTVRLSSCPGCSTNDASDAPS